MSDSNGTTRVSIPFDSIGMVTEENLRRHSFDLVHFPTYLERKAPARIRIEITTDCHDNSDLMGWFEDDQHTRRCKYASLVADDSGCLTDSDDFYRTVHDAFGAHADALTYIVFTRCGPPVYAPLFALVLLYQKYGRGLYMNGEMLPTPCSELTVSYTFALR
ncbi:hypothetical protein [Paraburkholderia domus]|uniref:hypothetical protein n=1 Tax=Paraburkholderia domus TaxID=2793075 RepID=UPI001912F700|nr:hypothetical protein [Paraburkholderia domus]MBK5180465.1 hypothetical protein [Burkholderia sp. R-69749]CAE6801633.1 hypothetical protein R69749_02647 [Paraburkholderia domus]